MYRGAVGVEAYLPVAGRRVSWGAIFAGAVVALVVELLLGTLGLAVTLGTIDPASEPGTLQGVGVGLGIWMALTTLLGLFVGGWTAGRLAGQPRRLDGAMHGVITWGLVTLLSTWMAGSAVGGALSGAFGMLGSTIGAVGQGIGALAPQAYSAVERQLQLEGLDPGAVRTEINRFLEQTGDPQLQPEVLRARVGAATEELGGAVGEAVRQPSEGAEPVQDALARLAAQGRALVREVDRQDAINVIMARTTLDEAQAGKVVDDWIATWANVRGTLAAVPGQIGQTAAVVTEDVTDAIGRFMFWSFVAMSLGLVAAGFGGAYGAASEVLARRYAPVVGPTEH